MSPFISEKSMIWMVYVRGLELIGFGAITGGAGGDGGGTKVKNITSQMTNAKIKC